MEKNPYQEKAEDIVTKYHKSAFASEKTLALWIAYEMKKIEKKAFQEGYDKAENDFKEWLKENKIKV